MPDFPPRGIRNKNPCNLRRTTPPQGWVGALPPDEATDADFEQFVDAAFGLRAAGIVLLHSQDQHGRHTIRDLITAWAPASDHNDTAAYVAAVADELQTEADRTFPLHDPYRLEGLLQAIVRHENGIQPYTPGLIQIGAELARRAVKAA